VHVADGQNSGRQGNVAASQPVGTVVAVLSLVMGAGDVDGHLQECHGLAVPLGRPLQRVRANVGMVLHGQAFLGVEVARLRQNVVGQAGFASTEADVEC
jgi:hypothetical protein